MIESVTNDSVGWSALRTVEVPVLRSFLVRNEPYGQTVIVTTEAVDGRLRLEATFMGVVGLALSWPEYPNPLHLDAIDVSDVAAHGLEGINFKVAEGAGFFAFSCRDFIALAIHTE